VVVGIATVDIKVVERRGRKGDPGERRGARDGGARQIESQSERGRRDGETACGGECEWKEREQQGEQKRERERERERRERERAEVLGLCVVVQGFVRPLRGCG